MKNNLGHRTTRHPSDQKSGIALIATLGLLAALLIMALGYAAVMRTERTAAANSTAIAQTRLLTLGALDSTINDINSTVWPNIYPALPTLVVSNSGPAYAKANKLVYGTIGTGGTKHFLPTRELLPTPGTKNIDADYQPIRANAGTELVGVYARILVDESGRLDFNYAGLSPYSEGPRRGGTNLYLNELSNLATAGSWTAIANKRDAAYHFYNQAELKWTIDTDFKKTASWPLDDYFTTYSRFAQYYNVGTGEKRRIDISQTTNVIASIQAEILDRLADAGIAAPNDLYTCIEDYTDANDLVAAGALAFGSEAVPMISELVVSNSLEGSGTSFTNTYQIGVELWYPFVGPTNTKPYKIVVNAQYGGADPSQLNPPGFATIDQTFTLTNRFMVFWSNPISATWTNWNATAGAEVRFIGGVTDQATGELVDQIPPNPDFVVIPIGAGPPVLSPGGDVFGSAEVDDPRINWRESDWIVTVPDPGTLGDTNSISTVNGDGDIYIANGPFTNVGDLGFIALGGNGAPQPWTSVDLVGNERLLLDVFTMHTNEYVHGLVNPNSQDTEVIATALYEAAIESYPGDPAGLDLNWAGALVLASNIVTYTSGGGGYFNAKSELTLVPELTNSAAQITENQQEAIIRQCADMMDVRGNTHTIVLAVRSVRDRTALTNNDPNNTYDGPAVDITLGEQMAVAQVWRDPVTKESKVTFFKWVVRTD